jgi:hypothetical protein
VDSEVLQASRVNRQSGDNQIGGATSSGFFLAVKRRRPSSVGNVYGSPSRILAPRSPTPPLTAKSCPPGLEPLPLDECCLWHRLAMSMSAELRCQFCKV